MPKNLQFQNPGLNLFQGQAPGLNPLFMRPKQNRKKFTPEEDQIIFEFVGDNKYPNWNELAALIPGKTGRQCRERYQNYLDPNLNKDPWTPEEDRLLLELYRVHGANWSIICLNFKGRTNNAVKNRFNTHLKNKDFMEYGASTEMSFLPQLNISTPQPDQETLYTINQSQPMTPIQTQQTLPLYNAIPIPKVSNPFPQSIPMPIIPQYNSPHREEELQFNDTNFEFGNFCFDSYDIDSTELNPFPEYNDDFEF